MRRTHRQIAEVAGEFLERRLTTNLSQEQIATTCGISRKHYGQIERGSLPTLTIAEMNHIAGALGLVPSIRVYPDGVPIRDVGHATKLRRLLETASQPVTFRIEVPLPVVDGRPERRAWDAVLFRGRERCVIELEMRLRDVQAVRRRLDLKRRDDPAESFVLLVADTRLNRRVLAEYGALFADLPRLRPLQIRATLEAGRLPRTGLLLV